MFSLISRNIARASPFTSRTLTVSVSKFHTSTCLFKDKNDNRSSGLAAPRKTVAKPETPKKEKTEDDKEKRKREQMEREKRKEEVRLQQLARSKERKEKEAALHDKKIEKINQAVAQAKFVEMKITAAEVAADKAADEVVENTKRKRADGQS